MTKSGISCVLRSADTEDAEELLAYLKTVCGETPYLIREPEEVTLTLEQERAFIQKQKEAERELVLIGRVDGRHVGNCSLISMGSFRKYAHRCSIGIALYQEYWGQGIGREMMKAVLDVAREKGYEQAELEAAASNQQAIALYQSLGFKVYGTFPHNMKYRDGSYEDTCWMMKRL